MIKKILTAFISMYILSSQAYAVELTEEEKKSAIKIAQGIEKIVNNKTPRFKNAIKVKLERVIKKIDKEGTRYALLNEILKIHLKMDFSPYIVKHYQTYNVDKNIIEKYWLDLHNNVRAKKSLKSYAYDQRLHNTAIEWSYNNYDKKSVDHKRDSYDSYYNYPKIEAWFQERGVQCKVKGRTTSTESIGKFGFYCKDNDCNDELKASLKKLFDMYMSEVNLKSPANAHYKTIVSPYISKIGLGITLYKTDSPDYYEYYMATHYCTEFK